MSDIDAPLKYSDSAEDKSVQDGSIGLLVLLALGLAFSAVALAMLTREAAEPFVLAILGGLAVIGVFSLFAGAVGILHFGERKARNDITKAFADNLPDGMLITDASGGVVYANATYLELVGAADARNVPTLERAFANQPQLSEPVFRLMRAARQGRGWHEDVAISPLDGAVEANDARRWLRLSVRQIAARPRAGKKSALQVWQVADMTSERAQEGDAFDKLQQIVAYLDRAPAGFLSLGREQRIDYINATLAHWLDRELADAAAGGVGLEDLMSADSAALVARAATRGASSEAEMLDVDLMRRDGTRFPARILLRANQGVDGDVGLAHMIVLNRSHADGAAEATAGPADVRFAHFFQSAPIAIASVDGEGGICSSNAAFARMFDHDEKAGAENLTDITSLIGEEYAGEFGEAVAAAKDGQVVIEPVDVTFGKDGNRNGRFYVSPVEQASEKNEVAIVYAIDTTEQRALEMQIAQSQKMQAVGQLAGGIAHDFNNVLTAIIGFSELLLANHRPTDPAFQDIMNIRQNANRAAALVRQLLAFSRQQTLQPEVLALGDVLSELTILLGRLLGEKIDLNVVHGRDLWKVKADLHQFEQVIVNLSVNARDAMPEGGKLTIRTSNVSAREAAELGHKGMHADDFVLCEVSDTGTGIAPEVLEKVFEPFFSTKEVGKGTGLGLSTVYGIIKQTGGYIYPDSEPGKGTIFRIYLPRHVETAEELAAVEPESVEDTRQQDLTGTGTVLLVEDEEAVRNFAVRALTSRGYEVLEAGNGIEALEVFEAYEGSVDLVISDVVMPEMDGPTLLGKLREGDPGIKVIFISGYAEDAFKKNLGEGEEFVMLPKPFSLKQLAATVKKTLES